jgi:hypothetical protein
MTRKILIAVAMGGVWAAYGCGSSGSGTATMGGRGQLNTGPIADLITPPADPNAPPGDPNAPSSGQSAPADPNAPPSDPNAPPGAPSGGSGRSCSELCAGIDQACAQQCASLCTVFDTPAGIAGTCNDALVAEKACISTAGLVCANHKVGVPGNQCNREAEALLACGSTTVTIHPGSGGEANGNGGQTNGNGAQTGGGHPPCAQQCNTIDSSCSQSCAQFCAAFDGLPPSCSDAVSTVKSCIMNAGLTCTGGQALPAGGACAQELSALGSCAQPPMGAGGTGP